MKLPMIVLKEFTVPKSDVRRVSDFVLVSTKAKGKTVEHQKLTVELREANAGEVRDLRSEKGVVAAALRMPVTRIKPLGAGATAGTKPPKVSWGISAVSADKSKFTGEGVTVAVLDTGIDHTHSAFKGVQLIKENFTKDSPEDTDGHGTHCAGTIFGRDVDGTRIGIARGVSTALIGKVIGEEGGSTEEIMQAISWALSKGAHVISMSLGMDFVGLQKELMEKYHLPQEQATSLALAGYRDNIRVFDKLSAAMSSQGVIFNSAIVAAAAGNESNRPGFSITVAPPAGAEAFLSVGALSMGSDAKAPYAIAEFSNEGARFAAPGVDIWSARRGGGLAADSGTSMAAPHVAGVAALWAEKLLAAKTFNAARAIELMAASGKNLEPHVSINDARHGLIQAPLA
jgi:subtilisin family serine protease